jgi:hypothetical protein
MNKQFLGLIRLLGDAGYEVKSITQEKPQPLTEIEMMSNQVFLGDIVLRVSQKKTAYWGMNSYIQEMIDNIKRIIPPENINKMINKVNDTRIAVVEISRCLDDIYQTRFYSGKSKDALLCSAAARLSLYAAILSFETSKGEGGGKNEMDTL